MNANNSKPLFITRYRLFWLLQIWLVGIVILGEWVNYTLSQNSASIVVKLVTVIILMVGIVVAEYYRRFQISVLNDRFVIRAYGKTEILFSDVNGIDFDKDRIGEYTLIAIRKDDKKGFFYPSKIRLDVRLRNYQELVKTLLPIRFGYA